MRYVFSLLLLAILTVAASGSQTDIVGSMGHSTGFSGRFPIVGGISSGTPAPTGDILLVDGVSLLLQTDGASFVCLAGGC